MLAQTGNPQDVKKDRGLEHIKLSVFFFSFELRALKPRSAFLSDLRFQKAVG